MILSNFKSFNVKRATSNHLKKQVKVVRHFNDRIKYVLIFVDENSNNQMLKIIRKELSIESDNCQIILYKEKIDKNSDSENCVSKNDFGLFGKFKNQDVIKIVNQPVDLLINYAANNVFLNNLVAKANAEFKVGFLDDNQSIYDLMIDSDNLSAFNSELKKYLKILNKIE